MPTQNHRKTVGHLSPLLVDGATRDLSDGQLLERFVTGSSVARDLAFAAILERHGPMVLRTCRGVLADPNDASDTFQATFLVLLIKARGLWVRESIGPWLHRVARQTAIRARASAARRARLDRAAGARAEADRTTPDDELVRAVHEEIARMPGRDRDVIVLCDLEGHTQEQAARSLGCRVGTVKSRLSRARGRLGDRLRRRGLAPDSGTLAVLLGSHVRVPDALAEATHRVATRFVAAGTTGGGTAAWLARKVVVSMLWSQGVRIAAVVVPLGAISGAGWAALGDSRGYEPAPEAAARAIPPLIEAGRVEAARSRAVVCGVPGTHTILRVLPDRSEVKQGQVVCELEPGPLWDDLARCLTFGDEAEIQDLADQFAACKLRAPADGRIILANDPIRRQPGLQIEAGKSVRERQILFYLIRPDDPMVVVVRVHAANLGRMAPGQRAQIRVDASPQTLFPGRVVSIPPRPDPLTPSARDDEQVYSVRVAVEAPMPDIQPGMTAQVEILDAIDP